MIPGANAIELLVSWAVTTGLTFAVVILDERKILKEEQLERAWPPSSRDAAIIAFGILAIPIHFIKTRGHFKNEWGVIGFFLGLLLGLVALLIVIVLSTVMLTAFAWAIGLPTDG